eukprot:g72035.t1
MTLCNARCVQRIFLQVNNEKYDLLQDCDIAPKGTRSKRIRPQTEQKESTTGKSPHQRSLPHQRQSPLAKSQEAKSDRKREQRRLHPSQGDAPAAEAKAPAAKAASAAKAKAAAAAAAAQDGSTGETAVFVNDQPEKGGARTQDEVLKDLAELSKISSAAKAGLLGADAVLRLDNDTPPALRKSNLTFIVKLITQYYYKFAPSASPEEQRDKMKALVIAYTVHDGPDEADAEVAYFAWLPEGQYWSNLGLDLVLDFVVTKQVPPEVVFLIGPGRQLLPEKPGTPAPKAFKVWKRQLLLSVSAKVVDDLRFCDEEDIDPVATKKYWDDHRPLRSSCTKPSTCLWSRIFVSRMHETVASGVSRMTTTGMAVAAAVGMAVAAAIMACTAVTEASSCRPFAAADKRIFVAVAAADHFFYQLHGLPLGLAGRVAVWRLVRWHGVPSAPIAQAT